MARYTKDPNGVETYGYDFAGDIASGDSVASTSVTATTGLTVDSDDSTGTEVKGTVSGGTAGGNYKLTLQATLAAGRVLEHSHTIHVRDL